MKALASFALLAALTGADMPYETPPSTSGSPSPADKPHTNVRLVARENAAVSGKPVDVAIVLESEPGWHTYWRNPGDAGMTTSVAWTLPKGWTASELQWPAPRLFQEKDIATFGYAGKTMLLSTLQGEWTRPGGSLSFTADVDFLECREICLPGSQKVTLDLPVKHLGAAATNASAFVEARSRLPADATGWKIGATWTAEHHLVVDLGTPAAVKIGSDARFFPHEPGVIEAGVDARLTANAKNGYSLELVPARIPASPAPAVLDGVLVSSTGAWRITVPLPPREI